MRLIPVRVDIHLLRSNSNVFQHNIYLDLREQKYRFIDRVVPQRMRQRQLHQQIEHRFDLFCFDKSKIIRLPAALPSQAT